MAGPGTGGEDASSESEGLEGLFADSPVVYVTTPSECHSDSDPLGSLLAPSPEAETGVNMASDSEEDPFYLDKLLASPSHDWMASDSEKKSLASDDIWASPDGETAAPTPPRSPRNN